MKKLAAGFAILLIVSGINSLSGQDMSLYAPFTNRLTAEPNGAEIVLSWKDAPESSGSVYEIYRHNEKISSGSIARAQKIAVVAPGIETFTDHPAAGTPWWYAVVTVNREKRIDLVIPWRNGSGNPVSVTDVRKEIQDAAVVNSLTGSADGESVLLSYETDRPDREITVFRSPEPVESQESLDHAVVVGRSTSQNGFLKDSPLAEFTWYYAAVDTRLYETGNSQWIQKAAFTGPFSLSFSSAEPPGAAPMRPAPLPVLRISRSVTDGSMFPEINGELPDKAAISPQALAALAEALGPDYGTLWIGPEPAVLDIDRADSSSRRQLLLKEIVDGPFSGGRWAEAEAELFALSAANGIDKATRARIQFYTGQCQYFQNDLLSAFLSFLVASDCYYPEARRWMLRIYSELMPVSGFYNDPGVK